METNPVPTQPLEEAVQIRAHTNKFFWLSQTFCSQQGGGRDSSNIMKNKGKQGHGQDPEDED